MLTRFDLIDYLQSNHSDCPHFRNSSPINAGLGWVSVQASRKHFCTPNVTCHYANYETFEVGISENLLNCYFVEIVNLVGTSQEFGSDFVIYFDVKVNDVLSLLDIFGVYNLRPYRFEG